MDDPVRIPPPPIAPRHPHAETRHGETLIDDYAWLRDPDWQAVMRDPTRLLPEIRSHLEAENAYCAAMMADTEALQTKLIAEMRGRMAEDDDSLPERDGAYEYFRRYTTGADYPVFCRRLIDGGDDEVILDGPREAVGQAHYRIVQCEHSPDHRFAACVIDRDGSELCEISFRDIASGTVLPDVLHGAQGDLAWANDSRTIFYTVLDDQHRPTRVFRHRLGDDPARDVLVYEEFDERFYLRLGAGESRRFIFISGASHALTTEVRLIDANKPDAVPVPFHGREDGLDYDVTDAGDRFFIRTNADGAEDYKIMSAPLDDFARASWRDLVPHQPGRFIRRIEGFADHLVIFERADALPTITVMRLSDGSLSRLAFDEDAYDLGIERGYEFATSTLRIAYSSMTTPERIIDVDMDSGARVLRKEQRIPSGHDPAKYVTRRLWAVSHDGARVPITVLHLAGIDLDGSHPMLLYGYGSYGMPMPALFSGARLSLVDRGLVYAIAHIRGGNEWGFAWYRDGKLAHKTNTFRDFIAVAEHLIAQGYSAAGRIVAQGRSAGGMLMGAIANMRPDLFGALLAEVPFVDVLNTICDASLPLTPPEWSEWGNPIESAEDYRFIRSYCPYSNVAAHDYPAILAVGGLTDPRVTYWEPAKWVAKLRATKTGNAPVLLHTVMAAGHMGAPGRFARLDEIARSYAFALKASGRLE